MKVLGAYEKARIYIEKHYRDSEEARIHHRKLNPGPVITISRETGVGAAVICEKLVEYFNKRAIEGYDDWAYFDKALIERIMEDHQLPDHFRKYLHEEKPPKIETWFGELLGVTPSKILLLRKISQTILKLADFGNVIIVGRGANIITAKRKNAFHIRLVAPLSYRIENACRLYNLDYKKAADFIRDEDDARKQYIWKFFHKNIEDPLLYHAVINTNLLEADEIAEMIGQCIVRKFPNFFSKEKILSLSA
jgi:cytidylate kinase